jgi:D-alanyl-D-alanine carboxypeptidase
VLLCVLPLQSIVTNSAHFPSNEAIDAVILKGWDRRNVPGMTVAVVERGKIRYMRGFGFADLGKKIPASPSTVYRIGSVTKQFTATLVMQAVEHRKVSLDDTLGSILPTSPKDWQAVTVRQLLNHTAGIPSYTELPDYLELIQQPVTPDHINDRILSKPLDFEPGTQWKYSNSGYILLGMILERLYGEPFREILRKGILAPLGMRHTYFTTEDHSVMNRARGYTMTAGRVEPAEYIYMVWPFTAGEMESTAEDLAAWDAALYGAKILRPSSLKQMWTPATLRDGSRVGYGMGWAIGSANGIPIVDHSGGINGFRCYIQRTPTLGSTVIVLTNTDAIDPVPLGVQLARFVDPRLAVDDRAIPDSDPELSLRLKVAVLQVLSGKIDPRLFSASMVTVFSEDALASMKSQADGWGPLKSMSLIKSKVFKGDTFRTYEFQFEKVSLLGKFVTDPQKVVLGFELHPQ